MALMDKQERILLEKLIAVGQSNPFTKDRVDTEQNALGKDVVETHPVWSKQAGIKDERQNIVKLKSLAQSLLQALHHKLENGADFRGDEEAQYSRLVWFVIYHNYDDRIQISIEKALAGDRSEIISPPVYDAMVKDADRWFTVGSRVLPERSELPHVFALMFQIRRAFLFIFKFLVGGSPASAALRASIWESIFTHNMERYRRSLFNRMHEVATLITGPSGTGKELVARAIGWSRYIPFNPKTKKFKETFDQNFYPISLASLSPTLLESELFGHKKGSFTGASQDRAGYLEVAGPWGTVFLDEIGEVSTDIQVKLLRVLQMRNFHRLGDTEPKEFSGKVIAATNRNLAQEIQVGSFRTDFYYRLCSDMIRTPSLQEQIEENPQELDNYVLYLAGAVGGEQESESLAEEVTTWISTNIPEDYSWPGNVRELEQCVRNVMVRGKYQPEALHQDSASNIIQDLERGEATLDDLTSLYCTQTYHRLGNYEAAARHLGVDSRTLKSKIDRKLLRNL